MEWTLDDHNRRAMSHMDGTPWSSADPVELSVPITEEQLEAYLEASDQAVRDAERRSPLVREQHAKLEALGEGGSVPISMEEMKQMVEEMGSTRVENMEEILIGDAQRSAVEYVLAHAAELRAIAGAVYRDRAGGKLHVGKVLVLTTPTDDVPRLGLLGQDPEGDHLNGVVMEGLEVLEVGGYDVVHRHL